MLYSKSGYGKLRDIFDQVTPMAPFTSNNLIGGSIEDNLYRMCAILNKMSHQSIKSKFIECNGMDSILYTRSHSRNITSIASMTETSWFKRFDLNSLMYFYPKVFANFLNTYIEKLKEDPNFGESDEGLITSNLILDMLQSYYDIQKLEEYGSFHEEDVYPIRNYDLLYAPSHLLSHDNIHYDKLLVAIKKSSLALNIGPTYLTSPHNIPILLNLNSLDDNSNNDDEIDKQITKAQNIQFTYDKKYQNNTLFEINWFNIDNTYNSLITLIFTVKEHERTIAEQCSIDRKKIKYLKNVYIPSFKVEYQFIMNKLSHSNMISHIKMNKTLNLNDNSNIGAKMKMIHISTIYTRELFFFLLSAQTLYNKYNFSWSIIRNLNCLFVNKVKSINREINRNLITFEQGIESVLKYVDLHLIDNMLERNNKWMFGNVFNNGSPCMKISSFMYYPFTLKYLIKTDWKIDVYDLMFSVYTNFMEAPFNNDMRALPFIEYDHYKTVLENEKFAYGKNWSNMTDTEKREREEKVIIPYWLKLLNL